MSVVVTDQTVGDRLDAFLDAASGHRYQPFRALADTVWHDGKLLDAASDAVPGLVAVLSKTDDDAKGYLAVLFGLLIEAEPASGGPVATAIGQCIDRYLEIWAASTPGGPLSLAMLYLLAHFPDDRDRILEVAHDQVPDADDRSRLDRALQRLDPARPVLGRVFPSPAVWQLDESEQQFDQAWIKALTPEQVSENWDHDTSTVLGHSGAKAYWAVQHGTPQSWSSDSVPPRDSRAPEGDVEMFVRHAAAFRCPDCGGPLEFRTGSARCATCSTTYPITRGVLDLTAGVRGEDAGAVEDFQFKLAEMPSMGFFYEAYARPNFLRLCGSNWGGAVAPADEDAYIERQVRPVDGPVLDLAAGAGRWTEVLVNAVGTERVIALDLNAPMLAVTRSRLPATPAVLASASSLPFEDASLGAVLCWNALQAFPADAEAAIAEVGRCLRPGGTFTFLTFRNSDDAIYRHFVSAHHFPQHGSGLALFDLDELKGWLATAGLTIAEETYPGTFVLITAERRSS